MPRFTTLTLSVVAFSACSQEPLTPPRPVADRQAPASYEMLDLGDLSAFGDGDRIVKLSDRGEIAGSRLSFTTFAYRSFFWDAGGLRDLGTLGGNGALVAALNNRGQVVGQSQTTDRATHAFLWQDGQMRDLGTLGGASSAATALNNQGQVVGYSQTAGGATHAFVWENGQMRDLGTIPGGDRSSASAINERGQIVGSSNVPRYSSWGAQWTHAALWDAGTVTDLGALYYVDAAGTPGAIESAGASDINERGDVVGHSSVPWAPYRIAYRAFLWQDGVMHDLGTLPDPNVHGSDVVRINNAGQIAGRSFREDYSDPVAGVTWRRDAMEVLPSLDAGSPSGYWMVPTDLNAMGHIVGYGFLADRRTQHAFVWEDGSSQDLGSLAGSSYAHAVNTSGDIAGLSEASGGGQHLVLWRRAGTPLAAHQASP